MYEGEEEKSTERPKNIDNNNNNNSNNSNNNNNSGADYQLGCVNNILTVHLWYSWEYETQSTRKSTSQAS